MGSVLEPCSTRAAWQVIPEYVEGIDLNVVSERIESSGWQCELRTRLCHTFVGDVNLTLFPSGKLLVKCADEELAQKIADIHLHDWLKEEVE